MRLTTFINESESIDHREIVNTLLRTCMPYLKDRKFDHQYYEDHLYSGRDSSETFFEGKIRQNREPKDTPNWLHKQLDNMFNSKFGVKSRSNSIFTSGSIGQASGYGHPYIIFPKGHYTIVWSEMVQDLYIEIKSIYKKALKWDDDDGSPDLNDDIEDMINHNKYDIEDYIETQSAKDWEKYYGEGTKGGIWTYTFDDYSAQELEKMGVKGRTRDVFIKGFKKEQIKDILHDRYGGLYPKNLVWSPDMDLEEFTDKNYGKYEKEYIKNKTAEVQNSIDSDIRNLINTYNKGDVLNAIDSNNEIMVSSNDGYCALSTRSMVEPIFRYFEEYGYQSVDATERKIGREKWEAFKIKNYFKSEL